MNWYLLLEQKTLKSTKGKLTVVKYTLRLTFNSPVVNLIGYFVYIYFIDVFVTEKHSVITRVESKVFMFPF